MNGCKICEFFGWKVCRYCDNWFNGSYKINLFRWINEDEKKKDN